jgi:hypothetical protein
LKSGHRRKGHSCPRRQIPLTAGERNIEKAEKEELPPRRRRKLHPLVHCPVPWIRGASAHRDKGVLKISLAKRPAKPKIKVNVGSEDLEARFTAVA